MVAIVIFLKDLPNLTVMMTKLEQVLEMLEAGRKIRKAKIKLHVIRPQGKNNF
jgi:hypothetical protein